MKRQEIHQEPFAGGGNIGFRCEANGGTAQLQFRKSDGTFVNQPDSLYSADELFKLDMYTDQRYRWLLTDGALMFRES